MKPIDMDLPAVKQPVTEEDRLWIRGRIETLDKQIAKARQDLEDLVMYRERLRLREFDWQGIETLAEIRKRHPGLGMRGKYVRLPGSRAKQSEAQKAAWARRKAARADQSKAKE